MIANRYKLVKLGIELGDGGKHLSCREIEVDLDISARTVSRYIHTLREEFGAPIVREWPGDTYVCSTPWSMIEALKTHSTEMVS